MGILIKKYRILFVVATVLLAFFMLSQFPKLTINPSFDDYIPSEVGNRANLKKLNAIFGGSEKIMLILEDEKDIFQQHNIDRLKSLSEDFIELDGIDRCMTLLDVIDIKLEDGFTTMYPIFTEVPSDPKAKEALHKNILNSSMGQRFVSSDFTSTAIILTKSMEIGDHEIIPAIESVILNNPGTAKVYVGGLAYIRYSIKSYIKKDLFTLLPASLLLMVLMLYFSFKEWKGVFLPFAVVVLSILFSFGIMALMGWEISLISVLLPIMLIAIANDYGIHLINLYQEKCNSGGSRSMKSISLEIYRELRKPILITALTTICGMLGLLSHKMPPAAELGVLASVGIGLALLMSLFLIPVLLSFYKFPKTVRNFQENKFINKVLTTFAFWVTTYPKRVVTSFIVVVILSISGLFLLKVDTNIEAYFIGKSDIKKGIELVNEKFGGSQYVSVLFNGNILSPETLAKIDKYTTEIKKLKEVGHVISPSLFFKELSKGMYLPGESGYQSLPESEEEALQYLEVFSMSGYEEQLSQFIDYNYENTRILVSINDGSNQTGKRLLKGLTEITKGDEQLVCIAGPGLSKIQIADMVIQGQVTSLIWALLIIFVLLAIIFKSVSAGAKASLPLLLSTLFLFGLMGFLGISLDIATTLLSSIMIGVGVDYTIHFLWRYKDEYTKLGEKKLAIYKTLQTTGRGIVFNALSVIVGFSVLVFSNFAPLRFFGFLVVVSIFSCLISALLLIPALITLGKAEFVEPDINNTVYKTSSPDISTQNKNYKQE